MDCSDLLRRRRYSHAKDQREELGIPTFIDIAEVHMNGVGQKPSLKDLAYCYLFEKFG